MLIEFPRELPEEFSPLDVFLASNMTVPVIPGRGVKVQPFPGLKLKVLARPHNKFRSFEFILFLDLMEEASMFGMMYFNEHLCPFGFFRRSPVGNPHHRTCLVATGDANSFSAEIGEFLTSHAKIRIFRTQMFGRFEIALRVKGFVTRIMVPLNELDDFIKVREA